jgi:isopentenyl diphosphate isomerase/L-lactate dehydrogenase-like FMN-dependent dehydrogenase
MDSGIRRATHVAKAIALGAKAVFLGRPLLYGLAARGEAGVDAVFDMFRADLQRTMTLLGAPQVDALGPEPLPGTAEQVSSDGCSERERAGKLLQPNDVGLD